MRVTLDSIGVSPSHGANDRAMRGSGTQRQMTCVNSPFVKHDLVAVVDPFHSQAQEPSRANDKRRQYVANQGRTKKSQQHVFRRLVVCNWPHKNQFLNAIGVIKCDRRRDRATVGAANHYGSL